MQNDECHDQLCKCQHPHNATVKLEYAHKPQPDHDQVDHDQFLALDQIQFADDKIDLDEGW